MGGRSFGGGRGNSRAPTEAVDRSKQTCVFFAQGICTKGDACQFSHATLQENGAGQAMNRAIGSGNEPQRTGSAEEHILVMPGSRNGDVPEQIKVGGADGIGTAFFGSAVRGTEERPPVVRLGGASTSMHIGTALGSDPFSAAPPVMIGGDGKTYVVGPDGLVPLDAVMRTMAATGKDTQSTPSTAPRNPATVEPQQRSTIHVRNERSRVAVTPQSSLQALDKDKDPQKSGIITLPGGGFVTRKRAAEMQLLGEGRGGKDLRCIRQRDAREQVNQHDRLRAEGKAAPQASGRPSIMDRLGPAKQQSVTSVTSTSWERVVGPKMIRPEVPAQSSRKREEPRQLSAPVDRPRDGPQVNRPSPLSRSQALGTSRSTRRLDDGSGQGTPAGTVVTTRPTVQHKPASSLDFKISTLDEIKTRKAKAKVKAEEARTEATATARKIQSGDDQTIAVGLGSSQGAEVSVVASPASVGKEDVSDTAPAIPVPSDVLKLEQDDMIEFRQWL